jgi:RNA polymerase sigma-70 factor (ECF subfamily)
MSPAVLRVLAANRARFLEFLERRVRRRDVAEEILQDAYVRGMTTGGALREDESAIAWFYRVLRNAMIDRARRESARQRRLADVEVDALAIPAEPDQELIDAICACVGDLVPTLRPEYASAIQRVELGGQSLPAFAAAEGITRGNAAVRVHRARQALRRRIEDTCGRCANHGCYSCQCRGEAHSDGLRPD